MATQQTWVTVYNRLRDDGIAKRGTAGKISATGGDLPRMTLQDATDILTGLQDEIVSVLRHLASPEHAVIQSFGDIGATPEATVTISIDAWLLCKPVDDGGDGLVRVMPAPGVLSEALAAQGIQWTAGVRYKLSSRQGPTLGTIASKRDRLYTVVAEAGGATWLPAPTITAFWKALYGLLIALRIGRETPTPGLGERILGGIKYAAVETKNWVRDEALPAVSEAAGSLAADVGTAAGKGLGAAAKGFTDQAGLTAYMMVVLGLFFVLR